MCESGRAGVRDWKQQERAPQRDKDVFQSRRKRNGTSNGRCDSESQSEAEQDRQGCVWRQRKGADGWDDRAGSVRMSVLEAPVFWICADAVVWALS